MVRPQRRLRCSSRTATHATTDRSRSPRITRNHDHTGLHRLGAGSRHTMALQHRSPLAGHHRPRPAARSRPPDQDPGHPARASCDPMDTLAIPVPSRSSAGLLGNHRSRRLPGRLALALARPARSPRRVLRQDHRSSTTLGLLPRTENRRHLRPLALHTCPVRRLRPDRTARPRTLGTDVSSLEMVDRYQGRAARRLDRLPHRTLCTARYRRLRRNSTVPDRLSALGHPDRPRCGPRRRLVPTARHRPVTQHLSTRPRRHTARLRLGTRRNPPLWTRLLQPRRRWPQRSSRAWVRTHLLGR